ncbi:helix-turn-helix domain-containing protein [uncultured Cardiobacterium sp.]|uniref:helix-turn-helix domain-containing protein n=1 Tax=uncultured Cardiobacterium sp. TaxID=417619 RepID=UPI0026074A17|nr:helix-turn-helix domain-containing protein [uncultured Cardiobacterium sp.]
MKLITADKAAAMLSISRQTLYRWAKAGKIPVLADGHSYRWLENEVVAYHILRWDLPQALPGDIPPERMEVLLACIRKARGQVRLSTSANTIAQARQLGRA